MNILFYISLFIFGTLFGSFASVIIHRLKSGEGNITNGRSHCFKCNKTLKFYDLFPILSYISTGGKCRYCKTRIPKIYPILEISTGLLFLLIGFFITDINSILSLNLYEILKLGYWLAIGFISILYIFYDILFLEIHEGIMLSGVIFAFLGLIGNTFGLSIIPTIHTLIIPDYKIIISSLLIGIFILASLYIIMLKELKIIYDIILLIVCILLVIFFNQYYGPNILQYVPIMSGLVGTIVIFIFFYLQIVLSNGKALGGGDLRIGIMVGLMLGFNYILSGIILIYIVGSIISIGLVVYKKIKSKGKKIDTMVPFGPFIGIGFFITVLLQSFVQKFIEMYFTIL